jgi:hypothetical protein
VGGDPALFDSTTPIDGYIFASAIDTIISFNVTGEKCRFVGI